MCVVVRQRCRRRVVVVVVVRRKIVVYSRSVDCCSGVRGLCRGGCRGVYMLITYPWLAAISYLVGRGLLVKIDGIDRAQAAVMGRAW